MSKINKLMQRYIATKKKHKAGKGKRFGALKKVLAAKGAKNAGALAAWIGRKKYGKAQMAQWSAAGRRK